MTNETEQQPKQSSTIQNLSSSALLIAILENGPTSMSDLSTYLGWTNQYTHRVVEELVRYRLVTKKVDLRDTRKVIIDFFGERARVQAKAAKLFDYPVKDEVAAKVEGHLDEIFKILRGA